MSVKGINNNELYFHSFGNNTFDVNAGVLSRSNVVGIFSKTGKVWRKFNKNTVFFN